MNYIEPTSLVPKSDSGYLGHYSSLGQGILDVKRRVAKQDLAETSEIFPGSVYEQAVRNGAKTIGWRGRPYRNGNESVVAVI